MPQPQAEEGEGGGWRSWFGLDKKPDEAPPASDAPAPPPSN
jgi:penicillin-binding protein 1B